MGPEIPTAVKIKSTVFLDVTQCNLVNLTDLSEERNISGSGFLLALLFDPEDGGSTFLFC
jgi:hypothetical protein